MKRRNFTLEEKYNICNRLENGVTNQQVAEELNISHSTLSTIWKNRESIKALMHKGESSQTKRHKPASHTEVDERLLQWVRIQQSHNVILSGNILHMKANEFLKVMNSNSSDRISKSWIQRFCRRYDINLKNVNFENTKAPLAVSDYWLSTIWPMIRQEYNDEDIYSADETALFYRLTPDQTLSFKGKKCINGEMSEDRITILVVTNITGMDKRKLFIVGKSQTPQCFGGVEILPVEYESNSEAWMTGKLFNKYLENWDRDLIKSERKKLLLTNNCPSHTNIPSLKFIKVVFLPPNTAAMLQPMTQGIIQKIKIHFRKQVILKFLQNVERNCETKIPISDAILMVHEAWNSVPMVTIANCHRRSGLLLSHLQQESKDFTLSHWGKPLQFPNSVNKKTLDVYSEIDKDVITEYSFNDFVIREEINNDILKHNDDRMTNIINSENKCNQMNDNTTSENKCNKNDKVQEEIPSLVEILKAVQIIQKYLAINEDMCTTAMKKGIEEIEKIVNKQFYLSKCNKQPIITNIFADKI